MPFTRPASLDAAIERLVEGNRRFVEERPLAPVASAHRVELASGQSPFAVVLGCSDSRVPIETLFDQQPGNLFVIRVAGNVVNDDGLASIEYGIDILDCMLVVVLGHSACGAVKAAMQLVEVGTVFQGHIQRLAEIIAPAARRTRSDDDRWWDRSVRENVNNSTREIVRRSSIVAEAIKADRIRVTGAIYDLHSGRVNFLSS
jgi:carbonic anhydrase